MKRAKSACCRWCSPSNWRVDGMLSPCQTARITRGSVLWATHATLPRPRCSAAAVPIWIAVHRAHPPHQFQMPPHNWMPTISTAPPKNWSNCRRHSKSNVTHRAAARRMRRINSPHPHSICTKNWTRSAKMMRTKTIHCWRMKWNRKCWPLAGTPFRDVVPLCRCRRSANVRYATKRWAPDVLCIVMIFSSADRWFAFHSTNRRHH